MQRKSRTQVPSLRKFADQAAERGRQSVFQAFEAAKPFIQDRLFRYADSMLSPQHAEVYKDGIDIEVKEDPLDIEVHLHGSVAQALDKGFDSFDMKPGLLGGPAAKPSKKGGVFVDVPFHHAAKEVPGGLKAMLKRKELSASELKNSLTRLDNGVVHKKSHLSGLTKTPGGELQTFRRVSSNSPQGSWIHPGFAGIHAAQNLASEVVEGVRRLVQAFLKKNSK